MDNCRFIPEEHDVRSKRTPCSFLGAAAGRRGVFRLVWVERQRLVCRCVVGLRNDHGLFVSFIFNAVCPIWPQAGSFTWAHTVQYSFTVEYFMLSRDRILSILTHPESVGGHRIGHIAFEGESEFAYRYLFRYHSPFNLGHGIAPKGLGVQDA